MAVNEGPVINYKISSIYFELFFMLRINSIFALKCYGIQHVLPLRSRTEFLRKRGAICHPNENIARKRIAVIQIISNTM